jgi:hypothetical protein
MDTVYPQLYVPTRPYWTSCDCRNATATNRYPVFGDGSVNCLTHFQKVFRVPELGRQGPAIFKTRDARTAFHSALRREQRGHAAPAIARRLGRPFLGILVVAEQARWHRLRQP